MKRLLEYGRKAIFLVRVLSGYEERRIRKYRLHLQERMQKAQAKRAELRRGPEQVILSDVRRMVEEMKTLNRRLDETEAAIEDYFKPIDKNAQIIMNMQLDKEEKQMKDLIKTMQEQALHHQEMAHRQAQLNCVEQSHQIQNTASLQIKNKPVDAT